MVCVCIFIYYIILYVFNVFVPQKTIAVEEAQT